MGCLEFWVVNSFLAALTFFILFLVVDTQYPLYPYAVAGTSQQPDQSKSSIACLLAAAFYVLIGLGLCLWQKSREQRIIQTRDILQKSVTRQQTIIRGPQLEL